MHTFEAPKGTIFNFNSDLSGSVDIKIGDSRLSVPARDVLAFVAETVRTAQIMRLEGLSIDELLYQMWARLPGS